MIDLLETIFFQNVLIASRDAAILALIVALVLIITGKRIPPVWRHGLLLLIALRLLIPVLPSSSFSWQQWIPATAETQTVPPPTAPPQALQQQQKTNEVLDQTLLPPAPNPVASMTAPSLPALSWKQTLTLIWLSGIGLILSVTFFQCFRFEKRVRQLVVSNDAGKKRITDLVKGLVEEENLRRCPEIVITDAVSSPALTGLFRPKILLPPKLAAVLSDTEISFVLRHELAHMQRHDVSTNWLLAILQAVHWFNPMIWWAFRRIRIEAERATDARVMQAIGQEQITSYGETLIRLLEQTSAKTKSPIPGVIGVAESRRDLKKRISLIASFTGKRRRLAMVGAFGLFMAIAAVGLTQAPKGKVEISKPPEITKNEKRSQLICHVSTEDGKPAAFATVHLQHGGGVPFGLSVPEILKAETDQAGRVEFATPTKWWEQEKQDRRIIVYAHDKSGEKSGVAVVIDPKRAIESGITIKLDFDDTMKYRITDSKGNPVPDLRIHITNFTPDMKTWPADFFDASKKGDSYSNRIRGVLPVLSDGFWNAKTDTNGICTISGLPAKTYLRMDHSNIGFAMIANSGNVAKSPKTGKTEIFEVSLSPAAEVEGTVELSNGQPAVGATVYLGAIENDDTERSGSSIQTDEKGHFKMGRLHSTNYRVSVFLPKEAGRKWVIPPQYVTARHWEVQKLWVLKPEIGVHVSGKVTLSDTGEPATGAWVMAEEVPRSTYFCPYHPVGLVDRDGNYEMWLAPGSTTLSTSGSIKGYESTGGGFFQFTGKSGGEVSHDFVLPKVEQITGTVIDSSGNPVKGATIGSDYQFGPVVITSDSQGRFFFPASKSMILYARHGNKITPGTKVVKPGDDITLQLIDNGWGEAKGRVIDPKGNPIGGVKVRWVNRVQITDKKIKTETITDKDGFYQAGKIVPYRLTGFFVSKQGFGSSGLQANIEAAKLTICEDIILHPAEAVVSGKVVDEKGETISGAWVSVSGSEGQPKIEIETKENGVFSAKVVGKRWFSLNVRSEKTGWKRTAEMRIKAPKEDFVLTLPDKPNPKIFQQLKDRVGKTAPPLKADSWFHSKPLSPTHKGKIRLIKFVGMDRSLAYFSNSIPPLQKLREKYRDRKDLEIIIVHGSWVKEEVAEILKTKYPEITIPLAIESKKSAMSKAFGVRSWQTVVIDRDGKVVFQSMDEWKEAKAKVAELLKKREPSEPGSQKRPFLQAEKPEPDKQAKATNRIYLYTRPSYPIGHIQAEAKILTLTKKLTTLPFRPKMPNASNEHFSFPVEIEIALPSPSKASNSTFKNWFRLRNRSLNDKTDD